MPWLLLALHMNDNALCLAYILIFLPDSGQVSNGLKRDASPGENGGDDLGLGQPKGIVARLHHLEAQMEQIRSLAPASHLQHKAAVTTDAADTTNKLRR